MYFDYGLAGLLMRRAIITPDAPAVAFGKEPVATYRQLMRRVEAFSAWAGTLGLPKGARVAIVLKNHPAWFEIMFGCWHAGLSVVPVNVKLHAQEVAYILDDCQASLMFFDSENTAAAEALSLVKAARGIAIDTSEYSDILHSSGGAPVAVGPGSLAWLFYTSGTTGKPKGAMLSHGNLLAMCQCYATDVEPEGMGSTLLHFAPMSHGSGLYMLPHVLHGSLQVVPESRGFNVGELESLLEHYDAVSFFAAPTMVTRLVDNVRGSLPGLHTVICGGAPMYVSDAFRFLERFPNKLAQIYGQGETPMTITSLPKSLHDLAHPRSRERLASCGVAQTGIEVRIVDDKGQQLPASELGEIIVRGPTVMAGYWNRPEETAKALKAGWLYTGDIGTFDSEGFLTLKDRSKDVIISGGSNIYPREVEEILLLHPKVKEVAVLGQQDDEWGETVVACIVTDERPGTINAELEELCLNHIARFKRPKHYLYMSSLPKNATGKVLKAELRGLLKPGA